SFVSGYVPSIGDSFDLLDWTGATVSGLRVNLLDFSLALLPDPGWVWDTGVFASTGTVIVAIPEPGRLVLCAAGLSVLFFRRRRYPSAG
ncbi:MAG: PEP-CTERM sorting domain-containing protein, partial [Prosthecobacter sp.]|nr:PEP-CTERM sorting domain-containing protein [Prosthecobacter sp.]